MDSRQIEPVRSSRERKERLERDLAKARQAQMEAEADLAREQAAVNAFRMHCRLKLDDLVDTLMDLRVQKQSCLTRLELLRQGVDPAWLEEDDDPLGEIGEEVDDQDEGEELLLPTHTPRDKAAEKRLYRELARRFHPDLAKTAVEQSYRTTMMAAVNQAYKSNDLQALYDLAGELEPQEVAELAGIESVKMRELRHGIMNARHQRRKAQRQLRLLRQENTARLWRRAQIIEKQGQDWWSQVRRELQKAITRLQLDIAQLRSELERFEQEG